MPAVSEIDLSGLIDLHIHAAPDVVPRRLDDVGAATAAAAAGMRAILIKSHVTLTADRAALAEKTAGAVRVRGGLALNAPVGGLNPRAVEVALRMGARVIWMPTHDAAHMARLEGKPGGISVLDDSGRLLPAVCDIVDLVREAGAMLATGHLALEETAALVRLARERRLRKVVVSHPEAHFIRMPVAMQEELAGDGVFFERCYVNALPGNDAGSSLAEIGAQIRRVGLETTVLSTDLGQAANPAPEQGMRSYLVGLLEQGFSWGELRRMAAGTPAWLLGLPGW